MRDAALPKVGLQASVRKCSRFWAKARANKLVLAWINKGVDIPFSREPDPFHHHNPQWSEEELGYWESTLLPKLLKEGAIRPVDRRTPFVSASRLEPKR